MHNVTTINMWHLYLIKMHASVCQPKQAMGYMATIQLWTWVLVNCILCEINKQIDYSFTLLAKQFNLLATFFYDVIFRWTLKILPLNDVSKKLYIFIFFSWMVFSSKSVSFRAAACQKGKNHRKKSEQGPIR